MTTITPLYHGFKYLGNHKKLLLIPLVLATGMAQAEEQKVSKSTELKTVNVEAASILDMAQSNKPIGTKQTISTGTISKQGGAEQVNYHKPISLIPGVDLANRDPYGTTNTLRIRGKSHDAYGGSGGTIEGSPVKGMAPGKSLNFDLENISSISVSKGPIAANDGIGFSTDGGIIDLKIQRPKDEFGGKLKQSLGSHYFKRTFVRIDSGNLGDKAKLFVSGSYTDADKWKGEGKSPDGNTSLTLGISSTEQQKIQWELFGFRSKYRKHEYRGLSYAESKDLKNSYKNDYSNELNGSKDANYYDYNRQEFDTNMLLGKLSVPVSENAQIEFKPYYSSEKGYMLSANGEQNTLKWLIDHATYGATLDYKHQFKNTDMVLGYWHGIHEPPVPPTGQKILDSQNDLKFKSWPLLQKGSNHIFQSPYIQLTQYAGNTEFSAGLKYMSMTSPSMNYYDTTNLTDVSYEAAFNQSSGKLFSLSSNKYNFLLPNLGATHHLNENTTIRASVGRNYDKPNYSFTAQVLGLFKTGKTLAELTPLWREIKPQLSNNMDVGMSYQTKNFYFAPTLFYSHIKNKSDSVFDPDLGFAYHQNKGEAVSYGLETAIGYRWSEALLTSLNFTYNKFEYTKNIAASGGTVIEAKNNQITNTPEFMASVSADWNIANDVILSPTVRYTGKRYADVLNKNSVNAHTLLDLSIGKSWPVGSGKNVSLQSQVINVFDKRYIADVGTPNAATTDLAESNNKYYYAGVPRTITVSVQLDF